MERCRQSVGKRQYRQTDENGANDTRSVVTSLGSLSLQLFCPGSFRQMLTTCSAPPTLGRDENVSKMDVDSVDSRPGRRPVKKRQDGRRRPVEKLSLVDVDQENVRMVDVDQ